MSIVVTIQEPEGKSGKSVDHYDVALTVYGVTQRSDDLCRVFFQFPLSFLGLASEYDSSVWPSDFPRSAFHVTLCLSLVDAIISSSLEVTSRNVPDCEASNASGSMCRCMDMAVFYTRLNRQITSSAYTAANS